MIERARAALANERSRARVLKWLWIVSSGFTIFGFAVMFYLLVLAS